MIGRISSIETLGALDGPGVRFIVFFQGCELRCAYCHNPETWKKDGGKDIESSELIKKIVRYKPYFGENGGVTFSGGEALLQSEFVAEMIDLCHQNGINTAVDTAGFDLTESVKKVIKNVDLIILDIKMISNELYKKYMGGSLDKTIEFLNYCNILNKDVWIRHVVVPNINDTYENVERLASIINNYKCIKKVELLPFENLCLEKYKKLGMKFVLEKTEPISHEKIKDLTNKLNRFLSK